MLLPARAAAESPRQCGRRLPRTDAEAAAGALGARQAGAETAQVRAQAERPCAPPSGWSQKAVPAASRSALLFNHAQYIFLKNIAVLILKCEVSITFLLHETVD